MLKAEITLRVHELLIDHLGVDPAQLEPERRLVPKADAQGRADHSIAHLGADSLDVVELVMAAEEEFDIEIPDDEAEPLNEATVEGLIEFIAGKVGMKAAA